MISGECKGGKQFALGSILNRENLSTILPFIELLIKVVEPVNPEVEIPFTFEVAVVVSRPVVPDSSVSGVPRIGR